MKAPRLRDILITAAILAIFYEIVSYFLQHPALPGISAIAAALIRELRAGLLIHAGISLCRVVSAIFISALIGCPLGILLAQNRTANRFLAPAIYLFFPVPKVVFVPLILLWFGIGDVPKVLLISLVLLNQIVVLVRDGVKTIPLELINSVRSLGARAPALFRFVYFPASLSALFCALRQCIGTAFAVLYLAEVVATRYGLGYYIRLQGSVLFDYPAMYAGIFTMALLGLLLFVITDLLEKRFYIHNR